MYELDSRAFRSATASIEKLLEGRQLVILFRLGRSLPAHCIWQLASILLFFVAPIMEFHQLHSVLCLPLDDAGVVAALRHALLREDRGPPPPARSWLLANVAGFESLQHESARRKVALQSLPQPVVASCKQQKRLTILCRRLQTWLFSLRANAQPSNLHGSLARNACPRHMFLMKSSQNPTSATLQHQLPSNSKMISPTAVRTNFMLVRASIQRIMHEVTMLHDQ